MSDIDLLGMTPNFWGRIRQLGLLEPAHLLWFPPARYNDYRQPIARFGGLVEGQTGCFVACAASSPSKRHRDAPTVLYVTDEAGVDAQISFFGNYAARSLARGDRVAFTATVGYWEGRLQFKNPTLVDEEGVGTVQPEYLPGKANVARNTLRVQMRTLVQHHAEAGVAFLERSMGQSGRALCATLKLPFADFAVLLRALHLPTTPEEGAEAQKALVRLTAWVAARDGIEAHQRPRSLAASVPVTPDITGALIKRIPFSLTQGQARAIREILADLAAPQPMHRILSGDVGCGKTISYLLPIAATWEAGRQACILMPNTLLAEQVSNELSGYFPEIPVVRLYAGQEPPASLAGRPVLVGTTAIVHWLEKQSPRPVLDLVVIDEQQKLGVEQKESLLSPSTNLLEATATAVPRSQALVQFGITAISRITEMPVEKHIRTEFCDPDDRGRVMKTICQMMEEGQQIALLYPKREAGEDEARVRSVEEAARDWEKRFPGKVGWIHGALKPAEKTALLARMQSGEIQLVVTSSVIEIGLTLPSLKMLMVVEAERYGASTLHQFRGRVARKGGDGLFIMLAGKQRALLSDTSRQRLALLAGTTDGMAIAEQDLRARGFGDIGSGTAQSGMFAGIIPTVKATPDDVDALLTDLAVAR